MEHNKLPLANKKILLGITGSIAAYKSADLSRRLIDAGADVKICMTSAATQFITPLTMQAVSHNPVHTDLLDPTAEAAMSHIDLARWADLVLIAPASASFIAHLAHGFADDLLTTLCLATTAPIILAPAMNHQMWENTVTQENVFKLHTHEIKILGPDDGWQACGEQGTGRMFEPLRIVDELTYFWHNKIFSGKNILITAGPTQEAIDPVRYITNHSSGKMGFALAEAAAHFGAKVTLISGPCNLPTPPFVKRIDIITAEDMLQAVTQHIKKCDIFISAAAVADYRSDKTSTHKIKKSHHKLTLELKPTEDILATLSQIKNKPFLVGFAAETENLNKNALSKLKHKKLDMIVANLVGKSDRGFNADSNHATVLWKDHTQEFSLMPKKQLAIKLLELIKTVYNKKS